MNSSNRHVAYADYLACIAKKDEESFPNLVALANEITDYEFRRANHDADYTTYNCNDLYIIDGRDGYVYFRDISTSDFNKITWDELSSYAKETLETGKFACLQKILKF